MNKIYHFIYKNVLNVNIKIQTIKTPEYIQAQKFEIKDLFRDIKAGSVAFSFKKKAKDKVTWKRFYANLIGSNALFRIGKILRSIDKNKSY